MSFNFPTAPSGGQIYQAFGKKWQYDATIGSWKNYLTAAGSDLSDLSNVIDPALNDGEFLTWDGVNWKPSASSDPGIYLTNMSETSSLSGSIFGFRKSDGSTYNLDYTQKVFYSGSDLVSSSGTVVNPTRVDYVPTASYTTNVLTASYYANDIYVTEADLNTTSSLLILSRSSGESPLTASLPFGRLKSVNGVTGSGALTNNIAVSIADASTGLSSSFPATPSDADFFIISGETATTRTGSNGNVFVYAESASNWFEISAPTDADRILRYVNLSGDSMSGSLSKTGSVDAVDDFDMVSVRETEQVAFDSGSRAMQGFNIGLATWRWIASYYTDFQGNVLLFNDTTGRIEIRTWVAQYTVPENTNFMSFQGGSEHGWVYSNMYHCQIQNITKNTILATNSVHHVAKGINTWRGNPTPWWNANNTVNSGPVPVVAGERIRMMIRQDWGSGTTAQGLDRGWVFSGYIHKTTNPNSLSEVATFDGLTGGGTGGTLTIAVNNTIARGSVDNAFAENQIFGNVLKASENSTVGDIDLESVSVMPGKFVMSSDISFENLPSYRNDAQAAVAGLPVNGLYTNGNLLCIRIV